MSLANISLKDYDTVVAVTQIAVNGTMAEYLNQHSKDIAIYAKDDGKGNITIVSSVSEATYILTGTLALEKDTKGNWINLVELKTNKGNQTVKYNITLQKGEFKSPGNKMDIKQEDTPWVISMFVNLALQDISKSDLPDKLKKQLQNVDENMFSIQQLYLDLNTAALAEVSGIQMPLLLKSTVAAMMQLYLKQQQEKGKPLFGISVKHKNTHALSPTFAPTYVNFCVTPYQGRDGKPNPNLDTLNYLIMTGHRKPPKYAPKSFPFNWVDDQNNHGAMAIKRELSNKTIVDQLNPILKTLCPELSCKADGHTADVKLETGKDHKFNQTYDANSGLIAFYSYDTEKKEDLDPKTEFYASGQYKSNTQVFLDGDKIKLSGSLTASGETMMVVKIPRHNPDPNHIGPQYDSRLVTTTMPKTTFNWSVEIQLYMDPSNNGQLSLKIVNPNFDSEPVMEKKEETWGDFLSGLLGGPIKTYAKNIGDLRGEVRSNVEQKIESELKRALKGANHFIFPGAKTFTFKNPTFSNNRDLVANITYLNPNA